MSGYPKARWSVGKDTVGASVWTRKLEDRAGEGGGYFRYTWARGTGLVVVEELVSAAGRERRQFPYGEKSAYVMVSTFHVPTEVRGADGRSQELAVAKLIHAAVMERFGPVAEWIGYDNGGRAVWFHAQVTGA
jgi:hypothetical protein